MYIKVSGFNQKSDKMINKSYIIYDTFHVKIILNIMAYVRRRFCNVSLAKNNDKAQSCSREITQHFYDQSNDI